MTHNLARSGGMGFFEPQSCPTPFEYKPPAPNPALPELAPPLPARCGNSFAEKELETLPCFFAKKYKKPVELA
jgi:hypothetical protein